MPLTTTCPASLRSQGLQGYCRSQKTSFQICSREEGTKSYSKSLYKKVEEEGLGCRSVSFTSVSAPDLGARVPRAVVLSCELTSQPPGGLVVTQRAASPPTSILEVRT